LQVVVKTPSSYVKVILRRLAGRRKNSFLCGDDITTSLKVNTDRIRFSMKTISRSNQIRRYLNCLVYSQPIISFRRHYSLEINTNVVSIISKEEIIQSDSNRINSYRTSYES